MIVLRSMPEPTGVRPHLISAELLLIKVCGKDPIIRQRFHGILMIAWKNGDVPQQWKHAIVKVRPTKDAHKGYHIKSMATLQECPLCYMPQKSYSKLSQTVSVTASKLGGTPRRTMRLPPPTFDYRHHVFSCTGCRNLGLRRQPHRTCASSLCRRHATPSIVLYYNAKFWYASACHARWSCHSPSTDS